MARLQLTFLGTGTSMGVPTLGCHCAVCRSTDPRDQRTRPSVALSFNGRTLVIDTSPDFRFQALRAGLGRVDAVLYTHGHADHILGLDDLRPFNLRQRSAIPLFGNRETLAILRRTFAYAFGHSIPESPVPAIELKEINGPVELFGVRFQPVPAWHGTMEVLGFRFGPAAYLTDFSRIEEPSRRQLEHLDLLVLDALRETPHPMHSSLSESLALVEELKPRRALFTHISHDLAHTATNARLPEGVELAYDTLTLELEGVSLPMRVYRSLAELPLPPRGRVVTVGNFDGVHRGHQDLLRRAVARARELESEAWAITFQPHPTKVLAPEQAPCLLTTLEQRLALLAELGLHATLVLPFTHEFAQLSPRDFVRNLIYEKLAARVVYVGPNFRFGHRQAGDVAVLAELAREFGLELQVVPPVVYRGQIVSSTLLRHLLTEGRVERAARLLNRPFALTGRISLGAGRGRELGTPTLNFLPEQECLPARGVYVTETAVDDRLHPSATNVGVRPTFGGDRLVVESHLLGFDQTLTEGRLKVLFYHRLRPERKFPSPEALRTQVGNDIEQTRRYFERLRATKSRLGARPRGEPA